MEKRKREERDGSSRKRENHSSPESIVLSGRLRRSVRADGVEGDSLACHDLDGLEIESGALWEEERAKEISEGFRPFAHVASASSNFPIFRPGTENYSIGCPNFPTRQSSEVLQQTSRTS